MFIKWFLFVVALCFFWLSFSSAGVALKLNIKSVQTLSASILKRNIMPIHFSENWNDFGWFIYFSNGISDETWNVVPQNSTEIFEVKLSTGTGKECKKQMKWFYYNAERWERLWPLDVETADKYGTWFTWYMEMTGWLYTLCRPAWYSDALQKCESSSTTELQAECVDRVDKEYAQDNAYYGMVKHTLTGSIWWGAFNLLAGVDYNTSVSSSPWIWINSKLVPNFIRFKNKIPVGLVYDNNGWVWFVGCRITSPSVGSLKSFVNEVRTSITNWLWLESLFEPDFDVDGNENGIKYTGSLVWVDCSDIGTAENSLIKLVIEGLVWMNRESDLWVIGNQTNAKMQYFSSSDINSATLLNYAKQRSENLCRWKWGSITGNVMCISGNDYSLQNGDIGKTLIVKNGNVMVKPAESTSVTWHYDVFINSWNLIINETNAKFVFDRNWFVTGGITPENFNKEVLKAYTGWVDYTWNFVAVGSFIRWNFIVNWKIKGNTSDAKLNNKYFIYGKFVTKDSFKDLEDTFAWRCNNWLVMNSGGAILEYCPPSLKTWNNSYENAFLVVIDQNYNSLLFWQ